MQKDRDSMRNKVSRIREVGAVSEYNEQCAERVWRVQQRVHLGSPFSVLRNFFSRNLKLTWTYQLCHAT